MMEKLEEIFVNKPTIKEIWSEYEKATPIDDCGSCDYKTLYRCSRNIIEILNEKYNITEGLCYFILKERWSKEYTADRMTRASRMSDVKDIYEKCTRWILSSNVDDFETFSKKNGQIWGLNMGENTIQLNYYEPTRCDDAKISIFRFVLRDNK